MIIVIIVDKAANPIITTGVYAMVEKLSSTELTRVLWITPKSMEGIGRILLHAACHIAKDLAVAAEK